MSLYMCVCVCVCVCVTLFLNVEAKMEDLSADLPQSLASLLLMSTSIPHAFPFLEMDIDFRVERGSERVVERHSK